MTHSNIVQLHSNASTDVEGVLHSFSSIEQLVDRIKDSNNVFEAIGLVNEVNEMNGHTVVSGYHVNQIKDFYRKKRNKAESMKNSYMQMLSQVKEVCN